jgi:transcriptional regulator with XRE-family HTH domain
MTISAAVRELRRAYGESQSVFAQRLGLSARAVASYEGKARKPDTRSLLRLAMAARGAGREDLDAQFSKDLADTDSYSGLMQSIRTDVAKFLAQEAGDVWLLSEFAALLRYARKKKSPKLPYMERLLAEFKEIAEKGGRPDLAGLIDPIEKGWIEAHARRPR